MYSCMAGGSDAHLDQVHVLLRVALQAQPSEQVLLASSEQLVENVEVSFARILVDDAGFLDQDGVGEEQAVADDLELVGGGTRHGEVLEYLFGRLRFPGAAFPGDEDKMVVVLGAHHPMRFSRYRLRRLSMKAVLLVWESRRTKSWTPTRSRAVSAPSMSSRYGFLHAASFYEKEKRRKSNRGREPRAAVLKR